jgi:hypothetical protein
MRAKILENGDLEISLERGEKTELRIAMKESEYPASDNLMHEWFEGFIGNGEYEFTRPEHCGALTDAPMLAIYGKERPLKDSENVEYCMLAGVWDGQTWVMDVLECWAFMDYQIISVQQRLLDTGKAVFQSGK